MMFNRICYINRKRLNNYNSIEELFSNILIEIGKKAEKKTHTLPYSGAKPTVIIKNILSLNEKSDVYHITGDVHYMALALKKNTVLTIHDIQSAFNGNFIQNLYVKLFWFWLPALFVKRITVISNFTKSELEQLIPFAKKKIQVIHNPISSSLQHHPYKFNTSKPQILFIGTKSNKNLERSFEAIKEINCKALIVGQLSEKQIKMLNNYNIEFESKYKLSYEEVIRCYIESDLVCFASTYEGFGMPIIEAQAIGRPVITSNMCSMPEVAGNSAYIVDPLNVDAIKNGILSICNDAELRGNLVALGLKNVERFQVEKISHQYLKLYSELISL